MKRSELEINKIWVGKWDFDTVDSRKVIFYNSGNPNTDGISISSISKPTVHKNKQFCTADRDFNFSEPTEEELELFYSFLPEYRYVTKNNDLFKIY